MKAGGCTAGRRFAINCNSSSGARVLSPLDQAKGSAARAEDYSRAIYSSLGRSTAPLVPGPTELGKCGSCSWAWGCTWPMPWAGLGGAACGCPGLSWGVHMTGALEMAATAAAAVLVPWNKANWNEAIDMYVCAAVMWWVMWLSCGCHVAGHVPVMWPSCGGHVAFMWLSCGCHVAGESQCPGLGCSV